jgi:hypothetical protein
MTQQRISDNYISWILDNNSGFSCSEGTKAVLLDLREARSEIADLKQSLFQTEQKELSQDMEISALRSRIREADRIIGQSYRHCVMVRDTGDLAYAITVPLLEILTQPLGAP